MVENSGDLGVESPRQIRTQDGLAEWSKALASGASPQGRGFEPHSCQQSLAKLCGHVPDHSATSALL